MDTFVSSSKWEALRARMAELGVREQDLIEKFVLGSGSGGQKINKTSSCVYIKHEPSGLEVKCQAARSRDLNRLQARRELCERLAERVAGERSRRQQEAERVRRQKRRRSRRQKARMLDDKRKHGEKKSMRRAVLGVALAVWLGWGPGAWAGGQAAAASEDPPRVAMTLVDAVVLGVVEGVTEYLPVSSTGHLLLTQRLLGIGKAEDERVAAEAYAVCIQVGAILAVLGLYFGRVKSVVRGVCGGDAAGLRLGVHLAVAFFPAALIGLTAGDWIKATLFGGGRWGLWPVVAAWFLGGVLILLVHRRLAKAEDAAVPRAPLEAMTLRMALLIGLVQCVAMWPGVSRSLATILGGVVAGLGLGAAVEFSFLLGLITLTASTLHDALKHGGTMLAVYGWVTPVVGMLVAMLSAAAAVRWMVRYLQRHGLAIFGYYRILLALGTAVLLSIG